MLLHPLSLPVLCIILICALLTVLQLFSCENSQLPGFGLFFQEKQTELPVFWVVWSSMWLACIIDTFIGVFFIIQNIPSNTKTVPAIFFFGRLYGFFWSVKIQIDNYCIFHFFHLTFLLFCLHKIRRILNGKVAVLIKIIFFFQSK